MIHGSPASAEQSLFKNSHYLKTVITEKQSLLKTVTAEKRQIIQPRAFE